jgi:signal transduction histidine kinase
MVGHGTARAAALTASTATLLVNGAPVVVPAAPLLEALRAIERDGAPRRIELAGEDGDSITIGVCRGDDGSVMLALPPMDQGGDPLGRLMRRMAGETDTDVLLGILCHAAAEQCGAEGAAVFKSLGKEGELVSAIGPLTRARGHRFALPGSVLRKVLRTRHTVEVRDFSADIRPLTQSVPGLEIGPMLLAPLIAHDNILGVLAVTRAPGASQFSTGDTSRLRVMADYIALALWKDEMLEQTQAADRAKSRFLATVSHELRTPLTALAGYEELLVDQVMGPLSESQVDVLERMRAVTQHFASVIEELLAFSSLDEGRETIRPTDFLAADLVQAAAAVIEPLARQKKLDFSVSLPAEPIRVTSDVDKVRQIVVNLASNAVKFTDAGEVRLTLDRRDDFAYFSVHDTGMGIAEEDLARLFQPFAQLDTGLTRRHGGTGLGLYISRGLAELLGGTIEVESVVGKGSTFSLVLPAE